MVDPWLQPFPHRHFRLPGALVALDMSKGAAVEEGDDIDGLRFVRERSPLPILADESCITSADIPRLVGAVDGINIKLAKCGGLREALRMIAATRTHGMLVMCGCMIETSLGITAAAHLAPLLDYADLDGAALVANDPFIGASIAGGRIALRDAPGLGVTKA